MKRVIAVLFTIVACACPSKATKTGTGTGSAEKGDGSATAPPVAGGCDGIKAKVEGLYRAEAQAKEPKRVEEFVSDNTTMVMQECAKAAAKVSACVTASATLKDLEANCMPKLDDEGTEAESLKN